MSLNEALHCTRVTSILSSTSIAPEKKFRKSRSVPIAPTALESDQQSPRASRMSRTEEKLRREAEAELDEEWNGAGSEDDQDGERDQVMADTDADEDMQDEEMSDSDEEPQKDEVELELEKEVFGDEAGFLDEINRYSEQVAGASAREDDNALAGIQDSEVCLTRSSIQQSVY